MILINRKDLPEANTTCKTCGRKYRLCNRCLKLRSMGIESWREYCDCIECYQVFVVLSKDVQDITKEEYDYIKDIQLPDGQEFTDEVKQKYGEVKKKFDEPDSEAKKQPVESASGKITVRAKSAGQEENKSTGYKKYDYNYNKKRNNKVSYKGKQ